MSPPDADTVGDAGAEGPSGSAPFDRLRTAIARAVAVDPRGLAALRVSLGVLLLADLALRARDLGAHYTDAGVLPRAVLSEQFGGLAALAFAHGLSGAAWAQAALFALAGLLALALALGYRTRLATAASFLLLVSLHARNPLVLNAGDSLLRRTLFWGLFLPLGGRWSLDRWRGQGRSAPVATVATAALLVQVVLVYVVNAVIKLRGDAWVSGEAIRLVFALDHLTVGLGDVLAGFPLVLEGLGLLWLAMLVASPLLLVLRGWPRAACAGLFAAMHLGMFLTMRLGVFPLVSMAVLLPFLPPRVWDAGAARLGPSLRRVGARPSFRDRLDPVVSWLPRPTVTSGSPRVHAVPVQALVAVLLVLVLVWNAASLGYVAAPAAVSGVADPGDRRWDMFAPDPRTNDGWFVVAGERAAGGTVAAFRGGPVSYDRPPELARTFPTHRWFVYLLHLPGPGTTPLRAAFAEYVCRSWRAEHDGRLEAVTVTFMHEPARPDGPEAVERVHLGRYACPTA